MLAYSIMSLIELSLIDELQMQTLLRAGAAIIIHVSLQSI
jgi:hypothetical protein